MKDIGDEKLSKIYRDYKRIQYKDPYKPISTMEYHKFKGFEHCSRRKKREFIKNWGTFQLIRWKMTRKSSQVYVGVFCPGGWWDRLGWWCWWCSESWGILRIVKVNAENPWILWRNVDEWMRLWLAALISKLVEVVPLDRKLFVLVGIPSRATICNEKMHHL